MITPKQYKQSIIWTVGNSIIALICAAAFLISAAFFIALESPWKWFWFGMTLCFLLLSAFFVLLVARPMKLSLDSDGFRLSGGWMRSPRFVDWLDIEPPVCSYSIGRGQTAIGYNLIDGAKKSGRWTDYNQQHFLPDATIPGVWRESTEQVADDINAYRAEVLSNGG
jgi:hypothetical protein